MRCTFTWDNGDQCKKNACVKSLSKNYQTCYCHNPDREICGAITKDGKICNFCWIIPGEECHHHKDEEDHDHADHHTNDPIESFSDDDLSDDEFDEQFDAIMSNTTWTSRSSSGPSQRPIVIIDLCDDDDDDNSGEVIQQEEEHGNINVKEEQRPSSPTRATPDQRLKEFKKQMAINDAVIKRFNMSIKKQKAEHFAKQKRIKEQLKKDYPDLFNNF